MKLAILVLALLAIGTLADNTITIDCHQCGPVACLVLTGGGFNGKDIPTNAGSCAEVGISKATAKFECGKGDCSEGCLLTETVGTQSMSVCTNTESGKQEVAGFNLLYSVQEGDITGSKTYDWCGCGLSTIAIVGIVVGIVVVVGIIGGLAYYFLVKKKQQGGDYGAMKDTQD